ncbi:MAG: sulfotransferase family protein [Steroidobacteraceae bacterium]
MFALKPILLLGPGRGGTTLLYKLLALHRDAAFVSNFDTHAAARPLARPALALSRTSPGLRRWAWFSAEGQAYLRSRSPLKRAVPAPVEGEELYGSSGVTRDEYTDSGTEDTHVALRGTFAAIQKRHRGKVLLLKRTANNRRIPLLHAAFPECRTIVLWRDGRAVTASLLEVHWWLDHRVWWAGGRTPREMRLNREQSIEFAATNWVKEVEAIEAGLARAEKRPLIQVHYEEMLARPIETITSLLEFIGLDVTDEYLRGLRSLGLRPATERWRTSMTATEIGLIERIGRSQLRKLSYG